MKLALGCSETAQSLTVATMVVKESALGSSMLMSPSWDCSLKCAAVFVLCEYFASY